MLDSTLSVRYRKLRYQAQSDIADHGYRTKCPPMANKYVLTASEICELKRYYTSVMDPFKLLFRFFALKVLYVFSHKEFFKSKNV